MNTLNHRIHSIPMYLLVCLGLATIALTSIALSSIGLLQFTPVDLVASLLVITISSLVVDFSISRLLSVASNRESWIITAFIIFLIFPPTSQPTGLVGLSIVAAVAMLSKYLLAWRGHLIFNPAAIAAVIASLLGIVHASWWVATGPLLPVVALAGFLIVHRLQRWSIVATFIAISLAVTTTLSVGDGQTWLSAFTQGLTSWPIVFLACIMLIEPTTLPSRRTHQLIYAALIALLMTSRWNIGPIFNTPELAIVIANLIFFIYKPSQQANLKFIGKTKLSDAVYEFHFQPSRPINFLAGQYLHLTIPQLTKDSRGNRRAFTISSSPSQSEIRFGIKFPEQPSQFKRFLLQLKPGHTISASTVAGHFTLPAQSDQPIILLAAGIGITPFISMLRQPQLPSTPIHLYHLVANQSDALYTDVLQQAGQQGVSSEVKVTNQDFSPELFTQDLTQAHPAATFYLSGPPLMIDTYRQLLKSQNIPTSRIKTDYFSGY